MRIKPIAFDIHGTSKYPKDRTEEIIRDITYSTYGIEIDLSMYDFKSYYRADGAKVTKSLTTLLRKQLNKEAVASKFAAYGKRISELYTTSVSLKAAFADKKHIGTGKYEGRATCFADTASNAVSKKFLMQYNRAQLLVVENKEIPDQRGRCIAFFAGGRNIILTNFYFYGLNNNPLFMIEALRRLLGLDQVVYRRGVKYFLPIYKNNDAILVYDRKSTRQSFDRKLPCPHCGKTVHEKDYYYKPIGATQVCGCSEKCARSGMDILKPCAHCGAQDVYTSEHVLDGSFYCTECIESHSWHCSICIRKSVGPQIITADGRRVCKPCFAKIAECQVCGEKYASGRNKHALPDGKYVCLKCIATKHISCEVCRCVYTEPIKATTINGTKRRICAECLAPSLHIPETTATCVAV